jgi:hypothetical protein
VFSVDPPRVYRNGTEQNQNQNVYDYITKLCRQQAEIIQNHDNENVRNTGQGGARHRLGGGQAYDRSSD